MTLPIARRFFVLALVTALTGCARPATSEVSVKELVFLTRGGCANTTTMRANLDEALHSSSLPLTYQFIDLATLSPSDPRVGYPTPTLLYRDRDLFGMSVPTPPFPEPTWRIFPDGVPSSDVIKERLHVAASGAGT